LNFRPIFLIKKTLHTAVWLYVEHHSSKMHATKQVRLRLLTDKAIFMPVFCTGRFYADFFHFVVIELLYQTVGWPDGCIYKIEFCSNTLLYQTVGWI